MNLKISESLADARFDDGTCAEVRLLEGGRRLTAAVPDTARVGDAIALMLLVGGSRPSLPHR